MGTCARRWEQNHIFLEPAPCIPLLQTQASFMLLWEVQVTPLYGYSLKSHAFSPQFCAPSTFPASVFLQQHFSAGKMWSSQA